MYASILSGRLAAMRSSLFLLALISFAYCENAVAQNVIRVGGTGLGTLLIQRLIEPYSKLRPDVQTKAITPPLGSNGGLRALAGGAIEVAIVSYSSIYPAKSEDDVANTSIPWVTTPFIFTGRDIVSGTNLTLGQVTDIYSGRLTKWADGNPVKLISRNERESDTRILRAISPEMDAAVMFSHKRSGIHFAENDFDNQQILERTPGSFGVIGLGQVLLSGSPLKPINLDGVLPTTMSLQSGAYRFEKRLYLIISKAPSAVTLDLIQYLQSPGVMKIIERYGFIPIQR